MLETERRERDIKAAEAEQKKQQAEVEKEKTLARARTEQDEKRVAELLPRAAALRGAIEPGRVSHYDRVMKLRGSVMAEVAEQRCLGCHVQLRAQVSLDVAGGEQVLTCDSCGRILYCKPAAAPPPPMAEGKAGPAVETSGRA